MISCLNSAVSTPKAASHIFMEALHFTGFLLVLFKYIPWLLTEVFSNGTPRVVPEEIVLIFYLFNELRLID